MPFNFPSFLDQILQKTSLLLNKLGCTHKALGQKKSNINLTHVEILILTLKLNSLLMEEKAKFIVC